LSESNEILTANAPWNAVHTLQIFVKIAQGIRPSVKISVWGSYAPIVAPMGVKFGVEKGTKFHPHRCNVSPLWGKNIKIGLWLNWVLPVN